MKPHFLMIITANEAMQLHTRLFLMSLEKYGKLTDYHCTICIQEHERITDRYILERVDVETYDNSEGYDPPWLGGLPRWKVEPKGDVCVFVDADMLAFSDLSPLFSDVDRVRGMIAFQSPFLGQEFAPSSMMCWRLLYEKLGIDFPTPLYGYSNKEGDLTPYYINYGCVVVPARHMAEVGGKIEGTIHALHKFQPNYHNGQIALAVVLNSLDVPRGTLGPRFNFLEYDKLVGLYPEEFDNCVLFHWCYQKKSVGTKRQLYDFVSRKQEGVVKERLRQKFIGLVGGYA